ncbi:MAG: phosphoesterase, partial [Candidatus Aminicenantales bacterium]
MAPRPFRAAAAAAAIVLLAAASSGRSGLPAAQDKDTVGPKAPGQAVLPVNQIVTPYGLQSTLPGLRPQALALSPDGKLLAVSGKTPELIILNAVSGKVEQEVALPAEEQKEQHPEVVSPMILDPDLEGQLSYTGLVFSPDGGRIFLSNVDGSIKVFKVDPDGTVAPSHTYPLPSAGAPRRAEEIPAGLAVTPDGRRLYVCGNLSNRLLELDPATGTVGRTFDVGVAPFDVVLAAGKAYVSNWGGGRPKPGDLTGPAGLGTEVRVDPVRHIASEGSVSVIDLSSGSVKTEIRVQLHASALALSPDGHYLVCANAGSDNLSVIDTSTDTVVETIWVKSTPADLFGASPNALVFSGDGKTLYVANGTQNAIAAVDFNPKRRKSSLKGLIPVGWFPGALAINSKRGTLYVANIKGLAVEKAASEPTGAPGFSAYQYHGSISIFPEPRQKTLWDLTAVVETNYRRERIAQASLKPRPGQPAQPVPERIGEPSVFKHVVYIIKENRTYDQILGDVTAGNGDPALCVFGEAVTPNQHKLVREFVLLDNTYCSGILSADGHQWSTTAFATDYLERSFAGWPRSYPDGMGPNEVDALAYAPSGFIWDNALKHGVSLWNFGEFTMPDCGWKDPEREGQPRWADYWDEYVNGRGEVKIGSRPAIPTVAPFSPTDTLGWNMDV